MIMKRNPKATSVKIGFNHFSDTETVTCTSIEEEGSFATIDGGMITQDEVNHAVNRGAGIFIGNYFVGISETYQCYINSPFGRFS